jgi:hypothetical protein
VNPCGCGIEREHQVRKSQILNDLRALVAGCELLAMLGDVDSDDRTVAPTTVAVVGSGTSSANTS